MARLTPMSLAINRAASGESAGGAVGTNPTAVASLISQWDVSSLGTTPGVPLDVTESEGGVVRMYLESASNASPPTTVLVDGKLWGNFGGANIVESSTDSAANILFGSGDFTICVVARPDNTTVGRQRVINKGSNIGGRYAIDINESTAGDVRGFIHDGSTAYPALSAGSQFTANQKLTLWLVRDGNTLRTFVNKTQVATDDITGAGDLDETGQPGHLSKLMWGGGPSNSTLAADFYTGLIGEVLFFSEALSGGDRTGVHDFLADKWSF